MYVYVASFCFVVEEVADSCSPPVSDLCSLDTFIISGSHSHGHVCCWANSGREGAMLRRNWIKTQQTLM